LKEVEPPTTFEIYMSNMSTRMSGFAPTTPNKTNRYTSGSN